MKMDSNLKAFAQIHIIKIITNLDYCKDSTRVTWKGSLSGLSLSGFNKRLDIDLGFNVSLKNDGLC